MSATFKNAKKKVAQQELRRYLNQHKAIRQQANVNIESPLAKYNEAKQLTCVLCKSVVRSEAVWNVHVNSKQHKENVFLAKKLKEETNNFTYAKRGITEPEPEVPKKKIKGILKNSKINASDTSYDMTTMQDLPAGSSVNVSEVEKEASSKLNGDQLPEGFFDDPKLDAKARHLEYKDPVEEEWEKFQKEIREADSESSAIIADDQEEATNERQMHEIEEQMKNWSRVLNLEKKKVEIIPTAKERDEELNEHDSSSEENLEFDEFLDWRAKESF